MINLWVWISSLLFEYELVNYFAFKELVEWNDGWYHPQLNAFQPVRQPSNSSQSIIQTVRRKISMSSSILNAKDKIKENYYVYTVSNLFRVFIITNHVSESWEIIVIDHCLLLPSLTASVLRLLLSLLLRPSLRLLPKAQLQKIVVESYLGWLELYNILSVSLTNLLVLFGLDQGQLLLFNPFSINLSPVDNLLFINVSDLDSFALVVLIKRQFLGLLYFNLSLYYYSGSLATLHLFTYLFILFWLLLVFLTIQFILHVANISSTPSLFSRPVSA